MFPLRSASRALLFAALIPTVPLVVAGPCAMAQSDTSSLSGTVTDPSGAVVPGANVSARNDANGQTRNVTTNSVGAYTLTNVPSGSYTVTVEAKGFQTAVQQGTHVDPSIGAQLNVSLKSGNTSTTVTVQANANRLQTESASVGQLVTAQQVKSIQLNGRNPLYLSQLEPGVTRNAPMSSFNFSLDNTLYVNGSRSQENLLTFDGAPMVRTRSNNNSVGVADVDSTSQVQILTTGYQPEYGRTSGGQVRMIPKSGTSNFHGAVYEYLRNSFFNANTWQRNNSPDPRSRRASGSLPLQPVRLEPERAGLHPEALQHIAAEAVFPRRAGIRALSAFADAEQGADRRYAQWQLQRATGAEHLLFKAGPDYEPEDGTALPQQRHSGD